MTDRPILLPFPNQLAGERVVVRQFRDEDAPEMFVAIQESADHIRSFLPWVDSHRTVDDTLEFIRHARARIILRQDFGMGIFCREDGRFLGGCGFHPLDWQVPSFEVGYWMREPEEGKGYVTEAAGLVTAFAFEQFGAQRVMIRCDTRNERSKAIAERLGYRLAGTMRRERLDPAGKPCDMLIFSMLPEEYQARLRPDRTFALTASCEGDGTSIADVPEEELLKGFGS